MGLIFNYQERKGAIIPKGLINGGVKYHDFDVNQKEKLFYRWSKLMHSDERLHRVHFDLKLRTCNLSFTKTKNL